MSPQVRRRSGWEVIGRRAASEGSSASGPRFGRTSRHGPRGKEGHWLRAPAFAASLRRQLRNFAVRLGSGCLFPGGES